MTRAEVSHLVAARTGESLSVIRRLGFQIVPETCQRAAADDLCLVVPCPFCREPVPYPGRSGDGSAVLAECADCDVYFEADDRDVFPASAQPAGRPLARSPPLHPRLTGEVPVVHGIRLRSPTTIPSPRRTRLMITLSRSQVRRLRAVFRRSTLGIHHRGIVSELVLRTDGGQLRAQHRYVDLAVEYAEPGIDRPAESLALPLDALADFEAPPTRPSSSSRRPPTAPSFSGTTTASRSPASMTSSRRSTASSRYPPHRRTGPPIPPGCWRRWRRRARRAPTTRPAMRSTASSSRAAAARSSPPTAASS